MCNYNQEFIDTMDYVNRLAQNHGWMNGNEWMRFASANMLISEQDKIEYERCHNARNSFAHGAARDFQISAETYVFITRFRKIMEQKIRDKKASGIIPSRRTSLQLSAAELDYLYKMIGDMQDAVQSDVLFDEAVKHLLYKKDELPENLGLLRAIRNWLQFNRGENNNECFLKKINSFQILEKSKRFTDTECAYMRQLLTQIATLFDDADLHEAAQAVNRSDEPFYRNYSLLKIIKGRLYELRNESQATRNAYAMIKAFIV